MGMNEPSEYSDSKIADVMSEIEGYNADEKINSNIIFVQLESFFDINSVKHITLSENPIPVFTKLKKEYSHGNLRVPTYSAGTANTEFEILTGMNIDYFGIGEFPFQTVAEKQTIESVAHIMSENGYKNHALHNKNLLFLFIKWIYNLIISTYKVIHNRKTNKKVHFSLLNGVDNLQKI
jgi:phosphoglycerol transferase MdoB-like AlkP superfamily enzyme